MNKKFNLKKILLLLLDPKNYDFKIPVHFFGPLYHGLTHVLLMCLCLAYAFHVLPK